MMYGYGWSWPAMLWMGASALFWLAVIALVIWLVWLLVRWLDRRGSVQRNQSSSEPTALEILRDRYARGEIDADAYQRMRERLGS